MKKAIFFFAFIFALGLANANAQSCCAGKTACANKMAKAAAADTNIEKRMADDGTVSYVRKEADAQGNVRFVSVQYDEATNAFVNVAPKTATASDKADMTKKACSSSEAKACSGAAGSGKACAGGSGKACCAGKTAKVQ